MQQFLPSCEATEQIGGSLYQTLPAKCLVFLHGDLGAGKTTLVRGFLRAAGHKGTVKSPTYNLVEEYHLAGKTIYHFDLYRLKDPEELEWIGINDYLSQEAVCFIEWPEQGRKYLPKPDISITLTAQQEGRRLEILK
ncbi:MAG: tRNA (adenosine(37)-N6)-threonylcarbamoyltransferase complex ATPase subunit type 1 TsaE [Gammaproteobacteria bacterium]|nr:tRNA (adenosine(37)-N6)-threonylcarbamoyltransferase complex ATPase subunit type 1 TsaE [Gammaproteobacteria bacterium]